MDTRISPRDTDTLMFFVNGAKIVEPNVDPETTLISYLRNVLRLTGTKLGCGEGGCGSCTVMISKWCEEAKTVRNFSVNACLAPLATMHLCAVTTVEGIGSTRTKLHEVQKRLSEYHGSQCGFCTPGIVMSMYALLRNCQVPRSRDISACLQGNLCRCTGYRPIIEAFNTFATSNPCCEMGEKCCMVNGHSEITNNDVAKDSLTNGELEYINDTTQETIFPPELMMRGRKGLPLVSLKFVGERVTWHTPSSLKKMIILKKEFPHARVVVGNTEVGIETKIKGSCYSVMICPTSISEMNVLKEENDGVLIGAACTLTRLENFLSEVCKKHGSEITQPYQCILEMLQLFAGTQIRNVACIGGNIMTASPISDINPILAASGVKLTFVSEVGRREIAMDENFFTGYRKTTAKSGEILLHLKIPFSTKNDVMRFYKQSKRKEDDIAIVNAGMLVKFKDNTDKIELFSTAFGGMSAVTKFPVSTMDKMQGRSWDASLLEDVTASLADEMSLGVDAPGGMVEYRMTLVTSFFFKFYLHVRNVLNGRGIIKVEQVDDESTDLVDSNHIHLKSTQTYQEVPPEQEREDTVGRPLMHVSGLKHVTGEAEYVDDLLPLRGELHMTLVLSSEAHAKILKVDTTEALQSAGVAAFVDKTDVPGSNNPSGEEVFADETVTCVGHVIGAILADTSEHALIASRKVKIEYEALPRILTIEEAIKYESYHRTPDKLKKGKPDEAFSKCDHVLEGEFRVGGQEHFYLETQACIAIPKNEDGEMELISSCQNPSSLQESAAEALGVASNKITVRVKRLGGGFGGKESRYSLVSNPAAVAASKIGRPVRCVLTRQDDMRITGGRHPFLARYKIGFDKDGRIKAVKKTLYSNSGNTLDLSAAVLSRAMTHAENCYNIENIEIYGYLCKTNLPSNTAFRGFGAPQAMLIAEDWISRVAGYLDLPANQVREINMYKDGDVTPYGHKLEQFHTTRCWKECLEKSQFFRRKQAISEFNATNKWKKRGIACVPTKFGIAFGATFLNQAGALVHIYKDGSVLLSHGGTEMGQGLHTKMLQIASKELGIPLSLIHTSEIATTTVPNTSATAASVGTDLNGMAVRDACRQLLARLQPVRKANPNFLWKQLVRKAYMNQVSLSASGFFKTPDLGYTWDMKTGEIKGRMYNYFTHGAAASEVEIDVLTGHHVAIRTDIVMDIGNSINPSIDIGQIEGGFAQGYGMMTLEELLYSNTGAMWTVGPGAYKLPGASDLPKEFNVHLLRSAPNDKAIYSSKAVGEPPLFLAASIFFAIKAAIENNRKQKNMSGPFRLDSPATAERIRMACEDEFTARAHNFKETESDKKPWAIRA